MTNNTLPVQQLDHKLGSFALSRRVIIPPNGWVKAIRTALGMSMQQLGNKLGITRQSVMEMERREKDGSVTLKSLREVAEAMDMKLVYGFVPNDGSLDALIDRKATELGKRIVLRTSNTMKLEGQENSEARIEKAIKERAAAIKNEMPKILWD